MSEELAPKTFRCLYCAKDIEITPDTSDEVDCPHCKHKVTVPGRKDVNLAEFDNLLTMIKTERQSQGSDGLQIDKLGMGIVGLNIVCFGCFWGMSAVDAPVVKMVITLLFLGASIGIFLLGITAIYKWR